MAGSLCLGFYDPSREFQSSEVRANADARSGREIRNELPAVIGADRAARVCQSLLARLSASGDGLKLRLPPRFLSLEPGTMLDVPTAGRWIVNRCTIEGFAVAAELRLWTNSLPPAEPMSFDLPSSATRMITSDAAPVSDTELALFDIPDVLLQSRGAPTILLAASSRSAEPWRPRNVEVTVGGQSFMMRTAARKSILGQATSVLGSATPDFIEDRNSVDIQLIDEQQWLESRTDEDLLFGTNLAVLGSEVIQFGRATFLGSGCFRLERLARGIAGTEWAASLHEAGEWFALIEPQALQPIPLLPRQLIAMAPGPTIVEVRPAGDRSLSPAASCTIEAERVSLDD
jgi:hypothetical protein